MELKKLVIVIFGLALLFSLASCAKKQTALEEMQQPVSPEELIRLTSENQNFSAPNVETATQVPLAEKKLEILTSTTVAKPTNQEIQTALKNAGYYMGAIDGKIGPKTKKAIEDFQKANNLVADGKVGRKTWAMLNQHLNSEALVSNTTSVGAAKKR